jgi:hypothetical protein
MRLNSAIRTAMNQAELLGSGEETDRPERRGRRPNFCSFDPDHDIIDYNRIKQ